MNYVNEEYRKSNLIISKIIAGIPQYSKSDNEYELKVFTYVYVKLATMMEYDDRASEIIDMNLGGYDRERAYDAIVDPANDIRALSRGRALCRGFAEILEYILNKINIKSKIISGKSSLGLHVWNQVFLDGVWYNCDLTNDYDFICSELKCSYFLKSNYDCKNFKKNELQTDYELCERTVSDEKQEELIKGAFEIIKLQIKNENSTEKMFVQKPVFIQKILNYFMGKDKEGERRK